MKKLVPIIGQDNLAKTPLLWDRLLDKVLSLGHDPLYVDAANVPSITLYDPRQMYFPFIVVAANDSVSVVDARHLEIEGWLYEIGKFSGRAPLIQGPPEHILSRFHTERRLLDPDNIANAPPLIRETWRLIYENIAKPELDVHFLASRLYVTMSTLERVFKHWGRCGVAKAVSHIRMVQAYRLVACTEFSLKDIAEALGFESQSYFSARFREHFKSSPSTMRQNQKSVTQN